MSESEEQRARHRRRQLQSAGPRTMEQFDGNLGCLQVDWTEADEAFVDNLVPPGEHSGKGFQDTAYPITGRG